MPQPLELNARQVPIIDEDGGRTVELLEPLLGLTPYVLLYCEELDPLGTPVFSMRFGGGLDITDIPSLLRSLHDNLIADALAQGVDLTQSTGGTDGRDDDGQGERAVKGRTG